MAGNILFRGILPGLITPLNDDATVKVQNVKTLIDWMVGRGVQGF